MNAFRRRTKHEPSQVLRYHQVCFALSGQLADDSSLLVLKGGKAVWIGDRQPSADEIRQCSACGAKRQYEFQIMPQLLTFLNVGEAVGHLFRFGANPTSSLQGDGSPYPDIDFGVLAVYTCSAK